MVIAAIAMVALCLFVALAIDLGLVWNSRTQSQNADDAAALAAALKMIDQSGSPAVVDIPAAQTAAAEVAALNATVANTSVTVQNGDITFGFWDLQNRVLLEAGEEITPGNPVDLNDPDEVTGVRVNVRMDGTDNTRSPAFLSGLAGTGKTGFTVNNTAVAYLGFEGSFTAGEFELPVAIDSCNLSSGGCGADFCEMSQTPDNPCALEDPQQGDGDVTCLEFSSTPEQNACWTVFDGDHPSVNTPTLGNIVRDGNPHDTQAGDEVYLDNGEKTPVTRLIGEKFYGLGDYAGDPHGNDRYPEQAGNPPTIDSWVVKLPVVECQDTAHCAGGSPFAITGGVCFEIREVIWHSDRLIKGQFLCPDSPDANVRDLFETYCATPGGPPQGPGGCNFGFRAQTVVLVE